MSVWTRDELDEWFAGDFGAMREMMEYELKNAPADDYDTEEYTEPLRCEADVPNGVCLTPIRSMTSKCPNDSQHSWPEGNYDA